ncbi:MAG: HAMP domain-containing sensor histidine kinase [Bacteroidota bacterium]|nr:HAMP domain-containing sensor histidine kinase [Bacteroidota bacterium]MDP4217886.1 HAMP domain-containing sensor histidine kinase [Bacteroidota bacterium]MDP4245058.1 HAMP domain-containing sensor histidine kinase [Bacteroidota bacterium]MDP4255198.1 HAMP domain-containing sensor histidine kinase [Bacteroidota bacterium]MDP4257655.1 HAMP domain-containing sensor histidine kinase [Bacteroidota bacterium]
MNTTFKTFIRLQSYIRNIGYRPSLGSYEKRKLGIFNLMNFFGVVAGILVPIACLFNIGEIPVFAWLIACSPALISLLVLTANYYQRYELARILYFILYPVMTSMLYAVKIDLGIEFFFVLYGVLSVFFLQRVYNIIFSFTLSMACYFLVVTIWKDYNYRLEATNYYFYLFNHLLAIFFIFYGLLLIRNENARYQVQTREKNFQLRRSTLKIMQHKADVAEKAALLETQTRQLTELNTLKNKLFSVIAHDLKAPLYALSTLFRNVQQYDLPGDEIKVMIPEVVKELSYTTGLMENLLQWAKSQMQAEAIRPQVLDIGKITQEVLQLLRLQAEAKHIYVTSKIDRPVYVYADKDMINLVLRNLLSNAIKFTPAEGHISIDAREDRSHIEVSVEDTGTGISPSDLKKLMDDIYYTTRGTGGETGTGLGLMLCKEFLTRNGGRMHVRSEQGKGSIFSFTLPRSPDVGQRI